jgi:hypothetical protein
MLARGVFMLVWAFVISCGMAIENAPSWTIYPAATACGLLAVIAFGDHLDTD